MTGEVWPAAKGHLEPPEGRKGRSTLPWSHPRDHVPVTPCVTASRKGQRLPEGLLGEAPP